MSTSPPIVPALSQGGTITGSLAVTGTVSAGSVAPTALAETVASANGTALINGTQNLLTWTAPNDGNVHYFNLFGSLKVTSAQTGGAVQVTWTGPGGTAQGPNTIYAGSLAAGESGTQLGRAVEANTTVTVAQSSAQTLGAANFYGVLTGA